MRGRVVRKASTRPTGFVWNARSKPLVHCQSEHRGLPSLRGLLKLETPQSPVCTSRLWIVPARIPALLERSHDRDNRVRSNGFFFIFYSAHNREHRTPLRPRDRPSSRATATVIQCPVLRTLRLGTNGQP